MGGDKVPVRQPLDVQAASQPTRPPIAERDRRLAPPTVAATLQRPGEALPPEIQARASHLGFDPARVRVHHDVEAGASARALRARAYAVRPHVVFAPGMYRPETPRGRALLLHELGHLDQQATFDPRSPLTIGASAAHERDASRRAAGGDGQALAMATNVVALDAEDGPSLDELARTALPQQHRAYQTDPPRTGTLAGGATYTLLNDGNVRVQFPATPNGQVIIHDADDPRDIGKPPPLPGELPKQLPTARLETGEEVTQREKKKLIAYDTPVVAVYRRKDVAFDRDGKPVAIRNLNPIEVQANTGPRGRLVQSETNVTTTGSAPARDQRDTRIIDTNTKEKEIRGSLEFSKRSGLVGDLQFDKLERSLIKGDIEETNKQVKEDRSTGLTQRPITKSNFSGVQSAVRGRSVAKDPKKTEDTTYVIASSSQGHSKQTTSRSPTFILPSGRLLTVDEKDEKETDGLASRKLENKGLENRAKRQNDAKQRSGSEQGDKGTTNTIYGFRPVRKKGPDGKPEADYELVKVASSTTRTRRFGSSDTAPNIKENRVLDKQKLPANERIEETPTDGAAATLTTVIDRGRGIRTRTDTLNATLGYASSNKRTVAPDATTPAAKAHAGQTDLIAAQATLLGTDPTNAVKATLNVSDTTATAGVDGTFSRGYKKLDPTDIHGNKIKPGERPPPWAEPWGLFTVDLVQSGADLAGLLMEGKASASLQRGGKDAVRSAAEAKLSAQGKIQLGYLTERSIKMTITPKTSAIPYALVRGLVEIVEPVVVIEAKAHAFAGAEVTGDASVSYGGDGGKPRTLGVSGFAGGRVGLDIDGSIQVGRPLDVEEGKGQGARVGSIKGGLAALIGASATWRSSTSYADGRMIVAGEGGLAFPVGLQGNLRAEVDLWKFGTVGVNVARKVAGLAADTEPGRAALRYYHRDDVARDLVQKDAHKQLGLGERVRLTSDLLSGRVAVNDMAAIVKVLEDAKQRGDLELLVRMIGGFRFSLSLDGEYNKRYHELLGR